MKKHHYIIIILILSILGGAFYWYEVRPSQIRKKCTQSDQTGFNLEKFVAEETGKTYLDEIAYKKCLKENGLND